MLKSKIPNWKVSSTGKNSQQNAQPDKKIEKNYVKSKITHYKKLNTKWNSEYEKNQCQKIIIETHRMCLIEIE
jgi:hypothetical protein